MPTDTQSYQCGICESAWETLEQAGACCPNSRFRGDSGQTAAHSDATEVARLRAALRKAADVCHAGPADMTARVTEARDILLAALASSGE